MKRIILSVIVLLGMGVRDGYASDAYLSMAYTNALGNDLPFAIFSKNSWSPDAAARFVKLHLYFDEPIMVKGLEINTCGSRIKPNLSIFFNFDQWIMHTDQSLEGEVPEALYPEKVGDLLILKGFEREIEVRSLTFNFEDNSGFRICGLNLIDPNGKAYNVKTPVLVTGTVDATSTLAPQSAYDPIFLFDSRFEYGWASNKQAKDVQLTFNFDEPRRVEKIRLWNGYQRSATHCIANSRARRIKITGDNGYAQEIEVKDILGSQLVALPKPFEGRQLKFEIVDAFLGKSYKDLVISEVRFFDGQTWFMLDPTAKLKEGIESNRQQFAKARVKPLLNDSYSAAKELKSAPYYVSSNMRIRADGSFYISGNFGEGDGLQYFALGNYEIKDANEAKGLKLRLFGLYYETKIYGDCNGCGRDCNKNSAVDAGTTQTIFQEFFTIKPGKGGKFEVTNEKGGKKIKFDNLEYSREVILK